MSKRKVKNRRNEEREAFYEQETPRRKVDKPGVFKSFKDIVPITKDFDLKFKNTPQRLAFSVYQQSDILFMLGCAGTGKSHLACMFAIHDIVKEERKKIVLTRPIVEAGEKLGFLPGSFAEKVDPYMMPLYDCTAKITESPAGANNLANVVKEVTEVAPLAFMRGRAEPLTADKLLALHRSHLPERGELSICMHRREAHTVSLSHVRVNDDDVSIDYFAGSPCETTESATTKLQRRR
jgi:phosphate starvation-inducible protein PhoH